MTRSFRPVLRPLEGRLVPACTAVLVGTTLTLTGTTAANTAVITDTGIQVVVTCDNIHNRAFSGVAAIVINLGDGSDKLTYTASDNALNGLTRTVVARLGTASTGGNQATFNVGNLGASGNPATFNLKIVGGINNDLATVNFGAITNGSRVNLDEALSAGRDPSSIHYNGLVTETGTQVFANVDLGTGNNLFTTVFGAGGFFLNNNNGQVVSETVIGSNVSTDRDTVRAFLNSRVDGQLTYQARLRAGDDTASVGVNYNSGFGVAAFGGRVQIGLDGGPGNDTLIVNHDRSDGTESTGGNGAFVYSAGTLFDLAVNGGAGDDRVTVDFDNGGLQIDADAIFRIRVNGDNGFDDPTAAGRDTIVVVVQASPNSNSSNNATVDVVVRGDNGNDVLSLTFTNNATTAFESLFTEIDGGLGVDTGSGNPTYKLRCEL